MAKAVRSEPRLIGEPDGLQVELCLSNGPPQGLAQGQGRILLAGEPVWHAQGENGEAPIEWTWGDLLEFLGRWWPWLVLEETYPVPVAPLYPGLFLQEAERRWIDMPAEQVEAEEEAAHRFIARHDLAEAFKGIFLPSLIVLRQGRKCHVSAASLRKTLVCSWDRVQRTLEAVGDYLAEALQESDNERARRAVAWWERRETRLEEHELDITTGLSASSRRHLEGGSLPEEMWQLPEIRAVARMTTGVVLEADQRELLARVLQSPRRDTAELDRLSACILSEFREIGPPHEQGYWAAMRLRHALGLSGKDPVDPEAYLEAWGIEVDSVAQEGSPIDAMTAWGERHGPIIVINRTPGARSAHSFGERATLAHEVAHLLLDREGALPAAEVLGGRTPEYPEKRARAFAAEFLLPRETAASFVRDGADLRAVAIELRDAYGVSSELLAWQISNSSLRSTLSQEELTLLEQWKVGQGELH